MSALLQTLSLHASTIPATIALQGESEAIEYGDLVITVEEIARQLQSLGIARLGILADNGIPWILADLAAMSAQIPLIPIPLFFSPQQMLHAMQDSGLDAVLTDRPDQCSALLVGAGVVCPQIGMVHGLHLIALPGAKRSELPTRTAKITYTSGTTGDPKGVCLSQEQMNTVATSLKTSCEARAEDRHLCLTPLSTLLENIGGVYVPLTVGAMVCVLPLRAVGLQGASGLDAQVMLQALHRVRASTAILAPQMLQALVAVVAAGAELPSSLRFVAVGGAPVSPQLLDYARLLGVPVYEGYGLSECASVVALNTPASLKRGSVGRPLPHVEVSFSDDGEVLVGGSAFLGYLGQSKPVQPWPTGDLGYLDDEGYLHLIGRKKSLFITSFGRNVAPEWVERELTLQPAIAQAAVYGEARPFNVAIVVPRAGADRDAIEKAISQANSHLPDYARVSEWTLAATPFMPTNGQLTTNGRLKRDAIRTAYQDAIESHYQEEINVVF
jgi:long-subunit acyl-CoA synthetase (AMP-forming)